MNPYIKQLIDLSQERFSTDAVNMPTSEWVCKNTTLKGRPFSLKRYEFQRKLLDDLHPNLDCIKTSQVGMTEIQIRKALAFLVRNKGTSVIFTLPNEDMFVRISNSRIKPLVAADKVFNRAQDKENKATRSISMMQFGQSFLYLVMAIESAATSTPADMVMNDELDLSDQKMVTLFNSRMQRSPWKVSQRFSTPTYPSYGIDLNWQSSDQHLYMCRCSSCNLWQHPEFTREFIHLPGLPEDISDLTQITNLKQEDLDFDQSYVKCKKCHKPLDLANPEVREWVPQYGSRVNSRGYRIGPFSTGDISPRYIFKQLFDYQKTEYIRGFHNTVLGQPYSDGNIQIPEADILACMTDNIGEPVSSRADSIWVGIDMGQMCHVTLGRGEDPDALEILSMYQVHVDDIVKHAQTLVEKYNVRFGCVDRHPYEPTSRDIFKASGGKIIPVEYRGLKDLNLVYDVTGENVAHVQVNNTWFLDNFAIKVRKRKIRISGYGFQKRVFVEHLRNMVRDEVPGQPATWTKLNGNDHYFHSSAFMAVAPHILALIRAKDDTDQRTMSLSATAKLAGPNNLLGLSKKKLAFEPTLR